MSSNQGNVNHEMLDPPTGDDVQRTSAHSSQRIGREAALRHWTWREPKGIREVNKCARAVRREMK